MVSPEGWLFAVMISESLLAPVALGWAVVVVIKMLREPKKPKEKRGSYGDHCECQRR